MKEQSVTGKVRILASVLLAVVALVVVSLIVTADVGRGRSFFAWVGQVPAGDKVGHLVMFGLLAFLANAAMDGVRLRVCGFLLLKGSVVVAIPVMFEEVSQLFFVSRTFDVLDLLADAVGISLGGWLALILLRRARAWSLRVSRSSVWQETSPV